ncbi:maleylpyruvate isomerase family mycothiol-dependent enzyme [Amycolatopsis sp. NPDC059021]|uniref:maleylpyruvate isomerase family mycothiol-dependent enzyme n=1 Tax=Amycolatopsis sp. NPDC059021 TaxID=3346704 RepID=UPI00366B94E0
MTRLSYERYCAEIITQTGLLAARIKDADLTTPVPSCPGWNAGQLLRHVGEGQRWAETVVRTKAAEPPSGTASRELDAYTHEDPAVVGPWLTEGAEKLAKALSSAGPGTEVWTPLPGQPGTDFYVRRFTHETAIHRADATLALGAEYVLDQEVAVDGIDEWMELCSLPMHFEVRPEMRELLGPGRTLHFHATDTPPEANAEWVVDLTGDVITWRRTHEKAAVAVRGPVTDLLLAIYKRRPIDGGPFEVFGDTELLGSWLERVDFG